MTNKIYTIWLIGFLLSFTWYEVNLGLMEISWPEPRIATGVSFILFVVVAWIVGWHPAARKMALQRITNTKQAVLFVLSTMGLMLFFALYEMYFMLMDANIPIAQGGFFLWRAWMSYIGLIIVVVASVIDVFVIRLRK